MEHEQNLAHWEEWAKTHKEELYATTKSSTIKRIEVLHFARALSSRLNLNTSRVLEVGCGNGVNGFALLQRFPSLQYDGVDFSPTMIESARSVCKKFSDQVLFEVCDARKLVPPAGTGLKYDAVFTNRMLINLATADEQLAVMSKIASIIKPGGYFLMLENSVQGHMALNEVRADLKLPFREAASYNVFIDQFKVIDKFKTEMNLIETEHVSGLHDIMQYAVLPSINGGQVNYDTPEMVATTNAIVAMVNRGVPSLLGVGQNILWVWQKSV